MAALSAVSTIPIYHSLVGACCSTPKPDEIRMLWSPEGDYSHEMYKKDPVAAGVPVLGTAYSTAFRYCHDSMCCLTKPLKEAYHVTGCDMSNSVPAKKLAGGGLQAAADSRQVR